MDRRTHHALIVLLLVTAWSGAACSWERVHRIYPIPFYNTSAKIERSPLLMERPPRRIAVLPFTAGKLKERERQEAVRILRETFQTGLSRLRTYEVVDLAEVDRRLAAAGITPDNLKQHSPEELGQLTGSDALVYCHVKSARNLTLYVYSHTVYDATLRLVDAGTGNVLWTGKLWEARRNGLVIEGFIVDMFISQPQNRKQPQAYRGVAETMVTKLIATIPAPARLQAATREAP